MKPHTARRCRSRRRRRCFRFSSSPFRTLPDAFCTSSLAIYAGCPDVLAMPLLSTTLLCGRCLHTALGPCAMQSVGHTRPSFKVLQTLPHATAFETLRLVPRTPPRPLRAGAGSQRTRSVPSCRFRKKLSPRRRRAGRRSTPRPSSRCSRRHWRASCTPATTRRSMASFTLGARATAPFNDCRPAATAC